MWALLFVGALFTFAGMSEMSTTVGWNDNSVRMYPRWGFKFLRYKSVEVQVPEITMIRDCQSSSENLNGLPFTTIEITGGEAAVYVRTDSFFREGIQQLVSDIARLRPILS